MKLIAAILALALCNTASYATFDQVEFPDEEALPIFVKYHPNQKDKKGVSSLDMLALEGVIRWELCECYLRGHEIERFGELLHDYIVAAEKKIGLASTAMIQDIQQHLGNK
ncbi:hypothetical protein HOD08_02080 [bacterium]|nr:hypothetical protein [bacterium]